MNSWNAHTEIKVARTGVRRTDQGRSGRLSIRRTGKPLARAHAAAAHSSGQRCSEMWCYVRLPADRLQVRTLPATLHSNLPPPSVDAPAYQTLPASYVNFREYAAYHQYHQQSAQYHYHHQQQQQQRHQQIPYGYDFVRIICELCSFLF